MPTRRSKNCYWRHWKSRKPIFTKNEWKQITTGFRRPPGLAGGKASKMKLRDFHRVLGELQRGMKIEFEHTRDPHTAISIAMDHLTEGDQYYVLLERLEKRLDKINEE